MTTVWYCLPHDIDKFINTSFPPFGAIYFLEGSRTSTMAPSEIWQHEMGHIAYYSSPISPLFINSMEQPCCFINQLLPSLLVHMKTDIPSISLQFISHCHGFSAAMHSTVSTPHCTFLCLGHEAWPTKKDECLNYRATNLNLKNSSRHVNLDKSSHVLGALFY